MNSTRTAISLAWMLLAFAGPRPGASQSPGGPRDRPSGGAAGVSGKTMVFEREVFSYPAGERRNPFLPVRTFSAGGPGVEHARLLGIIHHPDPAYSLAVLDVSAGFGGTRRIAGAEPGPEAERATARLRVGAVLGRLRIVRIHEDRVVIGGDLPEGAAKKVLAIPRPAPGR